VNYLRTWYVVQNWHCGFLSIKYETVAMIGSKSETHSVSLNKFAIIILFSAVYVCVHGCLSVCRQETSRTTLPKIWNFMACYGKKNSGLFENEVNGLWSRLLVTDDENRSWILGTSSSKADYLHQAKNTKISRCLRTYSVLPNGISTADRPCLSVLSSSHSVETSVLVLPPKSLADSSID